MLKADIDLKHVPVQSVRLKLIAFTSTEYRVGEKLKYQDQIIEYFYRKD